MTKIRIVAEIDDDIFDELCSYPQDRVNILIAEDAIIPKEESRINYDEEEPWSGLFLFFALKTVPLMKRLLISKGGIML